MSLGVIPIFWLEFLRVLEEIAKVQKERKLGKNRAPLSQQRAPSRRAKRHPRRVCYNVALLRQSETLHFA